MGRGKSFNHKKKGHPENYVNTHKTEGKEPAEPAQQVADFATYEAFKNRKEDEEE